MREQMRPLDDLEMGDLWTQAQERTPRVDWEPPSDGRPASSRVIAGVVAFAVFIAAGVFAWQALRRDTMIPVQEPSDGVAGVALWPERTAGELERTQALADAGDPTVAWRLDAKEVVSQFAEDILGWGVPASQGGGSYQVTFEATPAPGDPTATATVAQLQLHCPAPLPGEEMTCPPPYEVETVFLERLGTSSDAGIWSITAVQANELRLDLQPGTSISNDTQVNGSIRFPETAATTDGFSAEAGFHVGTTSTCDETQANEAHAGDGALLQVSVDPANCDEPSPAGYAWVFTSTRAFAFPGAINVDPLGPWGDDVAPRFYGLTLVPFTVSLATSVEGGTISGHLYSVGGPSGRGPRPLSGTVSVQGAAEVTVSVGSDGSFTVFVSAGRYTLTGRSPLINAGRTTCNGSSPVTITSGENVTVDVLCQIR
jgi:hypothetical protein